LSSIAYQFKFGDINFEIIIHFGNPFEEKGVKVCLRILRDFEILLEQNSKCLEAII